jgi:hypothetical protein
MTSRVYTAREVADMERIHLVTLYGYLKEGRFPGAYRAGERASWRIPSEAIKRHRQSYGLKPPVQQEYAGIEPYSPRSRRRKKTS